MMPLLKTLRVCRKCGLEVHDIKDLDLFVKSKDLPYGRSTLCKKCFNEYRTKRRKTNDRVYLKYKLNKIKNRCNKPNHIIYSDYGGRGITICEDWLNNQEHFVDWALKNGWKRDLTIDRVDNDGPYSPENCRWSTRLVQQRNRSNTVTFPEKGTRICCRCKIEKPLTDFHINRHHSTGRKYRCKDCVKETKE